MGAELIFEEPPAAKPGRPSIIPGWLVELRSHPGKWAKLPERTTPNTALNIKNGRYAGTAAGDYEAAVRNTGGTPRRCDLYARYIGGES